MDKLEELEKLAKLKEQWILTEDEFAREKRRVLEGRASETNEAERVDRSNSEFSKLPTYHDSSKDGPFAMFLSHRGRITRSQWIGRIVLLIVLTIPGSILMEMNWDYSSMSLIERMPYLAVIVLYLLAFYGYFAVTSKRFHDFNTHGINQMIPVYGFLAPLLKRGNGVDNLYGPPKTYSGVAEDVRPGLSPWFGWAIVAWIAAIFAVIAILGLSETESKNESGPTVSTEAMDSSELPSEGRWDDSKPSVNEWVKYESSEHGFVAEFPSRPTIQTKPHLAGKTFSVSAEDNSIGYAVSWIVPNPGFEWDSWDMNGEFVKEIAEWTFGKLKTFSSGRAVNSEWLTRMGFAATIVEDGGGKIEWMITVVDGWNLYIAMVIYEESMVRPKSVDRFLDSFTVKE